MTARRFTLAVLAAWMAVSWRRWRSLPCGWGSFTREELRTIRRSKDCEMGSKELGLEEGKQFVLREQMTFGFYPNPCWSLCTQGLDEADQVLRTHAKDAP